MRYLLMHRLDESRPEAFNPSPEFIARMGEFIEEVAKTGALITAEGVLPSDKGALIRRSSGQRTVTDGPFTEAKEVVGGFALVQVKDKAEAVALASRFADLFEEVEVEVRQVAEFSDIEGATS